MSADHNESKDATTESLGKVVIVGSGVVGRNWAVLFARGHYNVTLYDVDKNQLTGAIEDISSTKLPLLSKFSMLHNNPSTDSILSRISTTTDLKEALTDAIYIQTCVPEKLHLKQKVFLNIDNVLHEIGNTTCIIASSSSTIVPSKLIKLMNHKQNIANFLVCHPVNPPMAIPLVEVVPSPQTDKGVMAKVKDVLTGIGMKPVLMAKECDGFLVNRLQYGLLQIAYQMYEEGIASAEDIDLAVSNGLGLRWSFMGPFETIHLNAPLGVDDYCTRYAKQCIEPVVQMQNNNLEWKNETWTKLHNEMSEKVPVDSLKQRCEWRNNRLMELAKLKNEQAAKVMMPVKIKQKIESPA